MQSRKTHVWLAFTYSIALATATLTLSGCAELGGAEPDGTTDQASANAPSANDLLTMADVEKFQPGRSIDDILKDINWRGNLSMACDHQGKSLAAIHYQLFVPPGSQGFDGEPVAAIFVDDKFVKFVEPPGGEMETVDQGDLKRSRPKPVPIGHYGWLLEAVEADALDILELEKQVKERPEAPSQIDPGLTIVGLVLGPRVIAARKPQYKENAELRDRFNAARIRVGMAEAEVEKIFADKPLESGKTKSGVYKLYGSKKDFDIVAPLHFANVLVHYQDGKVHGIYSDGWTRRLERRKSQNRQWRDSLEVRPHLPRRHHRQPVQPDDRDHDQHRQRAYHPHPLP